MATNPNTLTQDSVSAYQLNADIVLSGFMAGDLRLVATIANDKGLTVNDFPENGYHRATYRTMLDILRQQELPTPENIYTKSGRTIPLDWLTHIYDEYASTEQEIKDAAGNVVALSEAHSVYKTCSDAMSRVKQDPMNAREIAGEAGGKLMTPRSRGIKRSFPDDIRKRVMQNSESVSVQNSVAGETLGWVDYHLSGGLQPKYQIGIGGGEKSRKTSFVRNLLLNFTRTVIVPPDPAMTIPIYQSWKPREKVSVAFLAYENDQARTYYDFVSMLAFEYLWKNHGQRACHKPFNGRLYHEWLNSENVFRADAGEKLPAWPDELQKAVQYGIWAMSKLRIAIYDAEQDTGGLRLVDDMRRVLLTHQMQWTDPGTHLVFVVDYIGLVSKIGGSKYEAQMAANDEIRWQCANAMNGMGATALTIGQYNTQAKRDKAQNADTGVIQVDNNPDLPRIVMNFIECEYGTDQDFTAKMLRSRRGKQGPHIKKTFWMHPATGYIIRNYNRDQIELFEETDGFV